MGSAERHWRGVLGGIANVVETLRAAGVPAPAVRAVTFATLRYIDGELLNALLLRRDCCSVSAAKALHTGLAALRELPAFVGAEWSCSREEAALALERSLQASRFLVQGKDDCVRKALKGMDVSRDLLRLCPALSLRQVHRLAELQHDDWLAGAGSAAGSQTLVLLDMLRRLMNERGGRMSGASGTTRPESAGTPPAPGGTAGTAGGTPGWVTFGQPDADPADLDLEDEEGLLVDSLHAFEMFRSVNTLTRRLLTDAAKFFVTIPKDGPSGAALHGPPSTPSAALRSPSGPLLPNGSLPQLSPSKTPGSPGGGGLMASPVRMVGEPPASPLPAVSLSSAIDRQSVAAGLPEELQQDPAFAFLSA